MTGVQTCALPIWAPWTLVEANDKHYARIKVLKTLHDSIERALG